MKRQPIQFLECSTITSVTHKLTRKIGGKLPECVCVWRAANFVAIIARWLQPTAEQMNNRVEGAFESNKKWREIVLFCGQSTWNHPRALNRFTLFSLSSYCSFDYGLHCSLEINVDVRAHGKSQTIENHVRSFDRSRSSTNQIIRILTCFFQCSQRPRNASINPLFGGSETMKNVTSITSFSSNVTFNFFFLFPNVFKNSQVFR